MARLSYWQTYITIGTETIFDKSKIAVKKIPEFAKKEAEFEKRTAFALIAALASHDKKMQDKDFIKLEANFNHIFTNFLNILHHMR